jgi:hypothetical protein
VGTQKRIHEPAMESIGLLRALECDGMFDHAGRTEVIDAAADSQYQYVVIDTSGRYDFIAVLIVYGADQHLLGFAIEPDHFAIAVAEPVPVGLCEVVELMHVQIDRARGQLMQVWLPEVGAAAFDERDVGTTSTTEFVAEPSDEFESAGATADDDDARNLLVLGHPDLSK